MMSLWYPPGRQKSKCSKNVKIQNMQKVHRVWWWSKWKAKGKLACMLFAVIHWVLGCSQREFLDIWLLIRGRIQRNNCNDFSEKTSVKIQFFNTVTALLSNSFLETKMLCFHWIRNPGKFLDLWFLISRIHQRENSKKWLQQFSTTEDPKWKF